VTADFLAVLSWLAQAIVASGLTILGFVGLKSTLDHYFQRKIAAFKHEQDKGIEGLKADLAHLGDRGRRANEREFDALSGIWDAFVDAFLKTNQAIISYRSFPDLDRLPAEDLAAFLEITELSTPQRQQVASATKKVDMYSKIMDLRGINIAGSAIFETRLLLRQKGIFVQTSMVDEFKNALEMLGKAQIERHIEFQHRGAGVGSKDALRLLNDGERTFNQLQAMVRTRLLRD
jgi:hypothetical protein